MVGVEPLVDGVEEAGGVDGAGATEGSALGLGAGGVGMEAESLFTGGKVCALVVAEFRVAAFVLAAGAVERAVLAIFAGSAGGCGALAVLRLGVSVAVAPASATLTGLSRVSVVVAGAASAGVEVPGAAVLATCGALSSTFLTW